MEWHACVKFKDDTKYYTVPISSIFFNKNDTNHIEPVDLADIDLKNKYYILWKDGIRYAGFIVCLGISEEDAKVKAAMKPKRLIIPKILTSSDSTDSDNTEDIDNPVVHINKKICKAFAQKESAKKVLDTYKSNVLINSRKDLNLDDSNDDSNENVSNNKNVVVNLTDFLAQTNSKTEDNMSNQRAIDSTVNGKDNILSDISNAQSLPPKSQKARKSFPFSKTISTQVLNRPSNEDMQQSIMYSPDRNLASPETIMLRDRLANLRRASISPVLSEFTPPRHSIISEPKNLFGSKNQSQNDISLANTIRTHTEVSSPTPNIPIPSEESPKNQENDVPSDSNVEESSEDDYDIDEENETQCKHLYIYKNKLYKVYKKRKIDMKTVIEENHERYEEVDDNKKIYLGLGCKVGVSTWRIAKTKKHTGFLRDLGGFIWKKRELSHRCLDLSKVKNKSLPGGSSVQLCSPRKLNLYLSIYEDYLNENKRYKNLTECEKDRMIQNSTETLSSLINVERDILLEKYSNKSKNRKSI